MLAIVSSIGWLVNSLCHKPWTLRMGVGETLSGFLTMLGWGQLFLRYPRTTRQRIISWVFVFTTTFFGTAVMHSSRYQATCLHDVVFAAIETTVAIVVIGQMHRRGVKKAAATVQSR